MIQTYTQYFPFGIFFFFTMNWIWIQPDNRWLCEIQREREEGWGRGVSSVVWWGRISSQHWGDLWPGISYSRYLQCAARGHGAVLLRRRGAKKKCERKRGELRETAPAASTTPSRRARHGGSWLASFWHLCRRTDDWLSQRDSLIRWPWQQVRGQGQGHCTCALNVVFVWRWK